MTNHTLEADVVRIPIAISGGNVEVPDGPGLGVEVDDDAVAHYRVNDG